MSKLQSPLLSAAALAVLLGLSSASQAAPSTEPIQPIPAAKAGSTATVELGKMLF